MGVAIVAKHIVTETNLIRLYASTVKIISFTERVGNEMKCKVGVAYAYQDNLRSAGMNNE